MYNVVSFDRGDFHLKVSMFSRFSWWLDNIVFFTKLVFSDIGRSNDLQWIYNLCRYTTVVITFLLICHYWSSFKVTFWSQWVHLTSNWSKIMTGQLLESLSFIWYVTRHWLWIIHFCGHGGHLRSHFLSWKGKMISNGYLIFKLLSSLLFIWYVT